MARQNKQKKVTAFIEEKNVLSKLKFNSASRVHKKGQNRKPRRWSVKEFEDLQKGVAKYGRSWQLILKDPSYDFGDRKPNDLNNKWTYEEKKGVRIGRIIQTKRKKPKSSKRWDPAETFELVKGIHKHGKRWKKILEDPEFKFKEGRTNRSLESKGTQIRLKNIENEPKRLNVMVDLHPHHAIVLKVAQPWQAFRKLQGSFKQERYKLFDVESQTVHIFGRRFKEAVKEATPRQKSHVENLLEQFPIDLEKKMQTTRLYYLKVLFWKTKKGAKLRKYHVQLPRTLNPRPLDYLRANMRERTQEMIDSARVKKKLKTAREYKSVMKLSARTNIAWGSCRSRKAPSKKKRKRDFAVQNPPRKRVRPSPESEKRTFSRKRNPIKTVEDQEKSQFDNLFLEEVKNPEKVIKGILKDEDPPGKKPVKTVSFNNFPRLLPSPNCRKENKRLRSESLSEEEQTPVQEVRHLPKASPESELRDKSQEVPLRKRTKKSPRISPQPKQSALDIPKDRTAFPALYRRRRRNSRAGSNDNSTTENKRKSTPTKEEGSAMLSLDSRPGMIDSNEPGKADLVKISVFDFPDTPKNAPESDPGSKWTCPGCVSAKRKVTEFANERAHRLLCTYLIEYNQQRASPRWLLKHNELVLQKRRHSSVNPDVDVHGEKLNQELEPSQAPDPNASDDILKAPKESHEKSIEKDEKSNVSQSRRDFLVEKYSSLQLEMKSVLSDEEKSATCVKKIVPCDIGQGSANETLRSDTDISEFENEDGWAILEPDLAEEYQFRERKRKRREERAARKKQKRLRRIKEALKEKENAKRNRGIRKRVMRSREEINHAFTDHFLAVVKANNSKRTLKSSQNIRDIGVQEWKNMTEKSSELLKESDQKSDEHMAVSENDTEADLFQREVILQKEASNLLEESNQKSDECKAVAKNDKEADLMGEAIAKTEASHLQLEKITASVLKRKGEMKKAVIQSEQEIHGPPKKKSNL